MYLHGAYLLWYVLEWAGGENRGVRNVYQSIGLNGSWDCWRVGWLGWKLVWCFWFLCTYTYVSSQCIVGNLTGMSRCGHLFQELVVSLEILSRPASCSRELRYGLFSASVKRHS